VSVNGQELPDVSRRRAMQWVLAAVAASQVPSRFASGQEEREKPPQTPAANRPSDRRAPPQAGVPVQKRVGNIPGGYGTDPVLNKTYKPGDFWPLTFDEKQKALATALADTIIPADKWGPAASTLGVVGMIDEWISAPYEDQLRDRPIILEGMTWLEGESNKRFGKAFAALDEKQREAICDDICFEPKAKPEFKKGAEFFDKFRDLTAAAYYATPQGWRAIGYIGNVMLTKYDGPPKEVLDKLGIELPKEEE
jgi:hypothetical protein